jgi:hypothetical protein
VSFVNSRLLGIEILHRSGKVVSADEGDVTWESLVKKKVLAQSLRMSS